MSIVVATNPYNKTDSFRQAIEIIQEEIGPLCNIYFMGHTIGAILGARFAHNHKEIKKMLLINGPLMINWLQTKRGVEQFQGETVTFVYGNKDPSYKYSELVNIIDPITTVKLVIINDADHNFKGMIAEFCDLPEKYLLK